MRRPMIVRLHILLRERDSGNLVQTDTDFLGWQPARPEPFPNVWERWRAAWLVFTGRADALIWPEDQEKMWWRKPDSAPDGVWDGRMASPPPGAMQPKEDDDE